MDIKGFLCKVALLSDLDTDEMDMLVSSASVEKFKSGHVISKQGVVSKYVWFICEGSAKVQQNRSDGGKNTIAMLGPLDIFGEISLISGKPSIAEVQADENCTLLKVPGEIITRITKHNRETNARLRQTLFERLSDSTKKLFGTGQAD